MNAIDQVRELSLALGDWERYETISKNAFLKDRDKQNMVLHAIFLAIQSSLDAAAWLLSYHKIPKKPGTYRETFEILAEYRIIDPDLGSALADLASLRNIII
ncbi:MAG: HepT-like ribonuclease domain-containing protein, partial [Methanobacteriota archaeon]